MKITGSKFLVSTGLMILLSAPVGCQPTSPRVDPIQGSSTQGSESRDSSVDIYVDPQNGVDIDVEGKRGGKIDVDVDDNGVTADVDDDDQDDTQ